LRTLWKIDYVK